MFPAAHRRLPTVALGLVLALVLVACGGQDLGKANFQRTTVPAEPGSGSQGEVPTGPITDPAVAAEALRLVDPCPLVGPDVLSELGTPGEPRVSGWDRCANTAQDAGGKKVSVSLQLGDLLGLEKPTGNVEGLPLAENSLEEGNCFVSALTSRDPDLGITAQVKYEGGDPCRAGRTVLQKVITMLRAEPATVEQPEGSVVGLDPCTGLDDAATGDVLTGEVDKRATSLHDCTWNSRGTDLTLGYRLGHLPSVQDAAEEVDLGGGVTGYQKVTSPDSAQCAISWVHRPIDETLGELVALEYRNRDADAKTDDACGKAKVLATKVAAGLP
ncbi:DUF3558 domain-containing protein [Amycolatopsis marina]|uniref:DUF3558 domain-containing protein n=1 Tax=Amycolatopsis marina TaxID=490629 RepID=UPI0015A607B7|nr:DUF3558 domain-containing protein [Amycolatopsis marina]